MVRQIHDGMLTRVLDNGDTSEAFPVINGVKQGCVLVPTLFGTMFTAMLTDAFCNDEENGMSIRCVGFRRNTKFKEATVCDLFFARWMCAQRLYWDQDATARWPFFQCLRQHRVLTLWKIFAVDTQFKQLRKRSLKKISGFSGIRTRDLCDTGAVLYQLSYEAITVGSRSILVGPSCH